VEACVVLISLLVGCNGPVDTDTGDDQASITIAEPAADAVVCGSPLHVVLDIENFTLVPPSEGSEAHPGEGHVDLYLNGQSVSMTPDEDFVINDVADGAWQLRADLVAADHTALIPYVGDLVYFSTSADACSGF
jgi:hypothetical protein